MKEKHAYRSPARRRARFLALMVAALLLASLACVPNAPTSAPATSAPATLAPPPPASAEAEGGKPGGETGGAQPTAEQPGGQIEGGQSSGSANITLTVVNSAASSVCYMRISPTTSSTWGDDWLGADTIASGASYDFSVPAGSYDLRAEFCGGGDLVQWGISLTTNMTWTLTGGGASGGSPGGGNATLRVVNNAASSVCYMRISPTTSSTWGDDWLGSNTIPSGSYYDFSVPAGSYDLRAELCGGGEATEMGVSISGSYTWTLTGAAPAVSGILDYTLQPNFGSVSMGSGFVPDPYTVRMVSGGSVSLNQLNLGPRCTGYASSAPDFRIYWTGGGSRLRIYFIADTPGDDATLIVNSAAANWRCRDDYSASVLDPFVEITNPLAGQYDIWIGSYWSGEYITGTLYITELTGHP